MAKDLYASKQAEIIIGNVVLMCLSGTAVALRYLTRRITMVGLWFDDYAIILALFFAYGPAICNFIAVYYDFGKHVEVTRPDAVSKWYELLYVFEEFYSPAIALTKLSILLFYARIFPSPEFKRYLYGVATVVFLWWIGCQFTTMFECTPISFFWTRDPSIEGHCIDVQKYFLGQAIPNIVTDLALLALPLPQIWRLNLPRPQKVALSGIFLLGSFVTFASIYRLTLLFRLTQIDITWNYADAAIWSVVEPHLGIVSACLPMLRPLYKLLSNKLSVAGKEISNCGRRLSSPLQTWSSKAQAGNNIEFARLSEPSEDVGNCRTRT